jgi:hypothetical protein
MGVVERASRRAVEMLGLMMLTMIVLASPDCRAQTISARTLESPKSAPGTGQFFQCIYEQKWPCNPSADHAPTVDQILAKYEESLGGAAALAKINTRVITQRRFQDVGTPEDHYLLRYTKKPSSEDGRIVSIMGVTTKAGTAGPGEKIRVEFRMMEKIQPMGSANRNYIFTDISRSTCNI